MWKGFVLVSFVVSLLASRSVAESKHGYTAVGPTVKGVSAPLVWRASPDTTRVHIYQAVTYALPIDYHYAQWIAESSSLFGTRGHLATLNAPGEALWISEQISPFLSLWHGYWESNEAVNHYLKANTFVDATYDENGGLQWWSGEETKDHTLRGCEYLECPHCPEFHRQRNPRGSPENAAILLIPFLPSNPAIRGCMTQVTGLYSFFTLNLLVEYEVPAERFFNVNLFDMRWWRPVFDWTPQKMLPSAEEIVPVPIFVILRDRLTVFQMALLSFQRNIETPFEVIVHDSGTSFPATLEFLDSLRSQGVKVWRGKHNNLRGVAATIQEYLRHHPKVTHYVVTDPDIEISDGPGDVLEVYRELLEKHPNITCVGPALRTDDIPKDSPMNGVVQWWYKKNHAEVVTEVLPKTGHTVDTKEFAIDSTFAMYRRNYVFDTLNAAIVVMWPYNARHLDWYLDYKDPPPDWLYYKEHCDLELASYAAVAQHYEDGYMGS